MKLIYRGCTYSYNPTQRQTTTRHPAINWRYQLSKQSEKQPVAIQVRVHSSARPTVVNWRYRVSMQS